MRWIRSVATPLLTALFASFALVPSATAVPPERSTVRFDNRFTDAASCAFPIVVRFVGRLEFTTFFDRHGDPVRMQALGSEVGTAVNPANGKTARGVDRWLTVDDLVSGESATFGLFVHLNFPGAGIVLIDAGSVKVDAAGTIIHMGGPHDLIAEDFSRLCAALA